MTDATNKSATSNKDVVAAEAMAFGFIKEVLKTAYKADGLRGVLAVSSRLVEAADEVTDECSGQGMDVDKQRAAVASHVALNWAPTISATLQKFIDAGGLDALLARGPEIEAAHAKMKLSQ